MASGVGTATLDFGLGSQIASVAVTGEADIQATSHCDAFIQANDSTADYTDYQHMMLAAFVDFVCGSVVAGTGFTINAISRMKLTGTVKVRWVWSD